jgi:hypothetical protein
LNRHAEVALEGLAEELLKELLDEELVRLVHHEVGDLEGQAPALKSLAEAQVRPHVCPGVRLLGPLANHTAGVWGPHPLVELLVLLDAEHLLRPLRAVVPLDVLDLVVLGELHEQVDQPV